jgi:syndecan 1
MAPEELWSVVEDTGSGAIPHSWGRRQTVGVPVAPELPCSLEVETGSGGLLGRRQTAGIPVVAELSPAGGGPVQEEIGSGDVSDLGGERETEGGPADTKGSIRMGMPASARMSGPIWEKTGSGGISCLSGDRQTAGVSRAVGLPELTGEDTLSEGLLGLSGRRQTVGMPVAASVSVTVETPAASEVPGPLKVRDSSSGDGSRMWRSRTTGVSTAARVPGPVEGEAGSEGVPGLWRNRCSRTIPEAVPLPLGMLAAVRVPMAGCVPAAVWVTGSSGEEESESVSGLTVAMRQSTQGAQALGKEMGGREVLGLARRGQAVGASYAWGCPRTVGEDTAYENVPGAARTRTAVSRASREEMDLGHFRNHPQQSGRRQGGRGVEVRSRGSDVPESYMGEDRLRGAFH